MQHHSPQVVDATKILSRWELQAVLADLQRKAQRTASSRGNLILVRLACCCGLGVSEISGRQLGDVRCDVARLHLRIWGGASKGGRPRIVPLWWGAGTREDLRRWRGECLARGVALDDPFLGLLSSTRWGTQLSRHTLRKRFRTACQILGADRLALRTIHHGRHTFISHALAGSGAMAEVRDAAGHANVSTTSAYLHIAVDDEESGESVRDGGSERRDGGGRTVMAAETYRSKRSDRGTLLTTSSISGRIWNVTGFDAHSCGRVQFQQPASPL